MAPEPWVARRSRACLPVLPVLLALVALAPSAYALRIVNYNILNYPGTTMSARQPHFRTVLAPLGADLVAVQEMLSQVGVDSFRTNVLNVLEPGQWASAPFINGNDTDNALFYKTSKWQFLGGWAFYPNPATNLRYVNCYRLKPVGYSSGAAELRIYSQHLKASQGFESDRLQEAIGIRDSMNAMPPGTHAILLGDFNIYTSSEPAFQKFLEDQADDDGRLYDPLDAVGDWNNNGAFATIHTQSPCLSGGAACANGASTGGMDDRFDMFLPTLGMRDGDGLDLIPGTYVPVGNDGLHLNKNITDAPVIPEGAAYASALIYAADHLPIRVDILLPARAQVSGGPFAFGTVITGATATTTLTVGNSAPVPADTLEYGLGTTAGFTAPAGPFARLAGPGSDSHSIGLDTATPGVKNGTVTVSSNDLDAPVFNVGLSGTVLRHAVASWDSVVATVHDSLDFGVEDPGDFIDLAVRLHNQGHDALQALLDVSTATIVGGAGRFSLVGGTAPIQLGDVGETYTVHFDDAGATRDSLYEAELVVQSADQALPGATSQPDVHVTLLARLRPGGATGVGDPGLPTTTRLHPPFPNPLRGTSTVHFDLARAADLRLEVFDLSGRRVATLAGGSFAPGRYTVRWDGRHEHGGSAGAGLYFVRMTGDGLPAQTARLAVVR